MPRCMSRTGAQKSTTSPSAAQAPRHRGRDCGLAILVGDSIVKPTRKSAVCWHYCSMLLLIDRPLPCCLVPSWQTLARSGRLLSGISNIHRPRKKTDKVHLLPYDRSTSNNTRVLSKSIKLTQQLINDPRADLALAQARPLIASHTPLKVLDATPPAQIPQCPPRWACRAACEMTSARLCFLLSLVTTGPTIAWDDLFTLLTANIVPPRVPSPATSATPARFLRCTACHLVPSIHGDILPLPFPSRALSCLPRTTRRN